VDSYGQASRFVREIPEELLEECARAWVCRYPRRGTLRFEEPAADGVRLGRAYGTASSARRDPQRRGQRRARARAGSFERQGTKWLMVQYANLEPL